MSQGNYADTSLLRTSSRYLFILYPTRKSQMPFALEFDWNQENFNIEQSVFLRLVIILFILMIFMMTVSLRARPHDSLLSPDSKIPAGQINMAFRLCTSRILRAAVLPFSWGNFSNFPVRSFYEMKY